MSKSSGITPGDKQRALVFQGGGALGAYEAGVFNVLYEKLYDSTSLFDIVAGTSAGAINAAILVSHVKKNGTWKDANKRLLDFWHHISSPTPITANFMSWMGMQEDARRYYSAKQFFYTGADNVFTPPQQILDGKFYDNNPVYPPTNTWFLYSNDPLRASIERFAEFPISTSFDKKEPRLLVVSVDVKEGKAVAFDSYDKTKVYDDSGKLIYTTSPGIGLNHVMSSGSFPGYFSYEEISSRQYCDGAIISNTPLREMLHKHRQYWKHAGRVPDLDAYVVDVWPAQAASVLHDYDGVKERKNDIVYSDKTSYDIKVANLISDYVILANKIMDLARKKGASEKEINDLLQSKTEYSKSRSKEKTRDYSDLLEGRFKLNAVKIKRENDPHGISNMWADFTKETISQLIAAGEMDAMAALKDAR